MKTNRFFQRALMDRVVGLLSALCLFLTVMGFVGCTFSDGHSTEVFSNALRVVSATPKGALESLDQFQSIVVIFNRKMVPLEALPEGNGSGPLFLDPPVEGKYRWLGTQTLAFTPSRKLPLATRFRARISDKLKSIQGESIEANYEWEFETLRPVLLRSSVSSGDDHVDLKKKIILKFNQSVRADQKYFGLAANQAPEPRFAVRSADTMNVEEKEWAGGNPASVIVLEPERALTMSTDYTLYVKKGLSGVEGSLGSNSDEEITFKTYGPLVLLRSDEEVRPSDDVKFYFSNFIEPDDVKKSIHLVPEEEIRSVYRTWYGSDFGYAVDANLKPRTTYTLTIDGNLQDQYGNRLGAQQTRTFRSTDFPPTVYFQTGELTVENYLSQNLNVAVRNSPTLEIGMSGVGPSEIVDVLRVGLWNSKLANRSWRQTYQVNPSVAVNQWGNQQINIGSTLAGSAGGFALVKLRKENSKYPQFALAQITNLGVTAKFSRYNNLIYVTDLRNAEPVGGARVDIYSNRGRMVWTGQTGNDGIARSPGWEPLGMEKENSWSDPPQYAFISNGGDKSYAHSGMAISLYPFRLADAYQYEGDSRLSGVAFTNQGIYKPGETVYAKAILRRMDEDRWSIPFKDDVIARVFDPEGEEVFKEEFEIGDRGSVALEFKSDDKAALGYYRVSFEQSKQTVASSSFQIQEFRPAESEVTITSSSDEYVWNQSYSATIDAHYLFGAPMGGAKIRWSLSRQAIDFAPPGYSDYVFGGARDHEYDYDEYSHNTHLISNEGVADPNGLLRVQYPLKNETANETVRLVLEATSTDVNRQEVTGRRGITVHAGEFYLGLKPSTRFMKVGEELTVNVLAVKPSGQRQGGRPVNLSLIRREWNSVREKSSDGSYRWKSEINDETESSTLIRTTGEEPVFWTITPQRTGYYVIKATSGDGLGNSILTETYCYVIGSSYAGWRVNDGDHIDLVVEKQKLQPGETARILVKSPFERTRALVTVEREKILSHRIVELIGNASTIEVPVSADMAPNVYVSVILLQGRMSDPTPGLLEDLGKPTFKIGYTTLYVNPDANRLKVDINTPRSKFAPGEWVDVTVNTTDIDGKAEPADITLYVEDVGVLNLTGYQAPDAFAYFYKPRGLGVRTSENRKYVIDQLMSPPSEEKGDAGGGGGDEFAAIAVRKDFKSCVYWNPNVVSGTDGKASVRFQLPENLTTFKIFAVAHTRDSKFGVSESSVLVTKELMLRTALPRFFRVGDEVEAGVIVHNLTDRDGSVRLAASMSGVEMRGPAEREIPLKQGESKEVRYKFKVNSAGDGPFTFKAAMDRWSDGVEVSLPRKVPSFLETVALYGSDTKSVSEAITVPNDIFTDAGGIQISTSSTALLGVDGGVQYLFEYPYGCIEQKVSRILPAILFEDVVVSFGLQAYPNRESVRAVVSGTLSEITRHQTFEGGFSYWPGSRYVSDFASAYAMLALVKAQSKGYTINQTVYDRGIEYLKSMVRRPTVVDRYGLMYWHVTQSMALAVLAENGYSDASAMELMFQRREEMPYVARAFLVKALSYRTESSQEAMIDELIRGLMNGLKASAGSVHFEEPSDEGLAWTFSSNVRSTAAVLQILLEVKGKEVEWSDRAVRYLMDAKNAGHWNTTQDNAYVFWALGTYSEVFEPEVPDFTARVVLDGKTILQEIYEGRSSRIAQSDLSLEQVRRGKMLKLDFNMDGSGRMYYSARMQYAPKTEIKARNEGLKIEKVISDVNGRTVSGNTFRAGQTYRVRLLITSAQDRTHVVVDDPLPAGWEAVNTTLATSASYGSDVSKENDYTWWYSGGFDRKELRDDRVLAFADWMERGTSTVEYLIRATTVGSFQTPPAKVEMMYHPEVFGNTASRVITVE